jgi:hypothetical protein
MPLDDGLTQGNGQGSGHGGGSWWGQTLRAHAEAQPYTR